MIRQDERKGDDEYKELARALLHNLNMALVITTMLLLLLQHSVLISGSGNHRPPHRSLESDRAALLIFRSAITEDPNDTLSNWNESFDVCRFNGVVCDKRHHRVSQLILNESHLAGTLSPFVGNLTGLRKLWIVNSRLTGMIPRDLSRLRYLRALRLDGNDFRGQIPISLFHLPHLEILLLLDNNLYGSLSSEYFSNCSSALKIVDLAGNSYFGKIPVEIGNCKSLWSLNLYNNQFTGELPRSLMNTSLGNVDVEYNGLTGELPSEIVSNLPELLYLHLSFNRMDSHDGNTNLSPFFTALRNCSSLVELELAGMGLGGRLPDSVGQLSVNLENLLLNENRITGSFPLTMSNLSELTVLNLSSNNLDGPIPDAIRVLPKLEQLFLSHNFFSGPFPKRLTRFHILGLLDLSHNNFVGEIPESIGNLSRLTYLFLNNNVLSGEVPSSLSSCIELHKVDLSHNNLSGKISTAIFSGISEIRIFVNFSHNKLEGPLPDEVSKLKDVLEIDLSSNNLTGEITPLISSCIAVTLVNFSHNSLTGNLPVTLGELKNVIIFDVSENRLSGNIPESINKCRTLTYLNLSSNDFRGKVPSGGVFSNISYFSLMKNPHICGNASGIRACTPKVHIFRSRVFLIVFSVVIFVSSFFTAICCVIGLRRVKIMITNRKFREGTVRRKPRTPEMVQNFPRITFRELSDATSGFDEQRMVGSGSYGRVYKGVLSDGTAVAVKVLQFQSSNSTKSFTRECQVLKRIRHRNLIRIITACSLPDFKALVLPYMGNGSLESRLYPHSGTGLGSGSSDLNILQRVNICSDIAEGMAYLHHHSPVKVIHCDLKPSNVLLNDDMTALVSDFGISRLVLTVAGNNAAAFDNMGNSTVNMLAGSIGYIAPEYGFGSITSTKGDVYSFGTLVLELVTRKRPIDDMFVGGLSLHTWVKSHYHGRMEKIVDSSLLRASNNQLPEVKKMWQVAIEELIELGLLCTQESPFTRPTMLDAADDLDRLKRYLFGDTTGTFASSLGISSSTLGDD